MHFDNTPGFERMPDAQDFIAWPKPCFFENLLAVSYKVTVFDQSGGLQESVIEVITAILADSRGWTIEINTI